MNALVLMLLSLGASPETDVPDQAAVRQAVERSLPYLMKSSGAWRNEHKCVTCHQVPFALWPLHEGRTHGLAIDEKFTADLTAWSLEFCTTNKKPDGTFTGGFLSTMVKISLALEGAPKREEVNKAYEFFVPLIAKVQKPDGSFKDGNFIGVKDAEREGIEVDTMWTILGLGAMEKQAGDSLSPAARESITTMRTKALAAIKDAKPQTRTDWVALRMLVERAHGDANAAQSWRKELLARQHDDGAWPFTKGGKSHPLVTGECLYALSVMGLKGGEPEVQKAWKYLVGAQEADGSWKSLSRQELGKTGNEKFSDVATHWGTGWAAVGLLRTLPSK